MAAIHIFFRNYCKYNKPETCSACVSVELQYSNYVRRVSIDIYIINHEFEKHEAFVEVISKLSL